MLTFAIDQSTPHGSMAILDGSVLIAETAWEDSRRRNQHLFMHLPGFLESASLDPGEIRMFAVGLGPGSFTGLRISLAAAQGMALPDHKPVRGIGSGMAIAHGAMRMHNVKSVGVVGDARRGRLWVATFEAEDELPVMRTDYRLTTPEELPSLLDGIEAAVSPEWSRIHEVLRDAIGTRLRLVEGDCTPKASCIAALAIAEADAGQPLPPPPLTPIYLHPPVFVEPRFPASQQPG